VSPVDLLVLLGRSAAALVLIAGTLVAARVIAWRLVPRGGLATTGSATVIAGMWLAAVGFHLLARLGLFMLPVALAAVVAVGGLAGARAGRAGLESIWRHDRAAARRLWRRLGRSRWRTAVAVVALLGAGAVIRALILPPLGWDTLTYHGMKAAFWVQKGRVVGLDGPGVWALTQGLFGGGEVFSAWAMLPFSGDLFASLADAAEWIAVGVAALALAREVGVREPFGTLAAGALMAVPTVRLEVASGYVELALVATFVGASACAVRFIRRREPGALLLCGAGFGVACSCKATLLLTGAVALAGLGLAALTRPRALGSYAGALLAFTVVVAPWLVDNTVRTGYPLSPYPVTVAGITLGETNPTVAWDMDRPELHPFDLDAEATALRALFRDGITDAREGLGLPTAIPLVVFIVAGLAQLARARGRERAIWGLLVALVAAVLYSVYNRDFAFVRLAWPYSTARYVLPALGVAIPASMIWCRRWPGLARIYRATLLAWACFTLGRLLVWGAGDAELDLAYVLGKIGIGVALVAFAAGRVRPLVRRWAIAAAILAGFTVLVYAKEARRWDLVAGSTVLHWMPKSWLAGARMLDDPHAPRRIAVTAGPKQQIGSWFFFYFFGRRLQNELEYVPVTTDGAIVEYGAKDVLRPLADREAWLARLDERKIDVVAALDPKYVELEWMEALPTRFTRMSGVPGVWGVFRVVR
jgi:hypothetical protein